MEHAPAQHSRRKTLLDVANDARRTAVTTAGQQPTVDLDRKHPVGKSQIEPPPPNRAPILPRGRENVLKHRLRKTDSPELEDQQGFHSGTRLERSKRIMNGHNRRNATLKTGQHATLRGER